MAVTIDLAGQVAVVTGGTRGVGAGIARSLLTAGAEVVVCARRAPGGPVRAAGRTARFQPLDVTDPDAVEGFFRSLRDTHGHLDLLVNNAGGSPYGLIAADGPRRAARVLELNLTAPMTVALAAYGLMCRQETGGSIVMVGSVSGTRPSPGTAAYGAAKAGLENLARTLAVEWAPAVRVNTLVLGMVRTERSHLHYGDADGIAAVGRTVPLGRLAEPAEAGDACVFLASGLARYITGASLAVHGGGERPAFLDAATANAAAGAAPSGPTEGTTTQEE
ncbi:SDR family oxidoreductase [Streptomyces sp. HD1123-B1]|uniref:SDR family oxidoreductase n=1 Tax=Streptomyces huangiella TaxID=3228804 RepID=UPI003D7C7E5B